MNRSTWLTSRKKLLRSIQAQLKQRLGVEHFVDPAYSRELDREWRKPWRASSYDKLWKELKVTKLVLGADFHAYAQAQRAHLRILREWPEGQSLALCLECFSQSDQKFLDQYVKGLLSAEELKSKTKWETQWGFPFDHYLPLLLLAKQRGFLIYGLDIRMNGESADVLKRRDLAMAKKVSEIHRQNPDVALYAIVGEYHLARKNLPSQILAEAPEFKDQMLVLYLDSSELYFKLGQRAQESSVEVMSAEGNAFCLMVSPPWMKWQSYLMFLDHSLDQEIEEEDVDLTQHVWRSVDILSADLGVQISFDETSVMSHQSSGLQRIVKNFFQGFEQRAFLYNVENDRSFFVPRKNILYLSRLTVNHTATLAAFYVHAQLSRRRETFWNFPNGLLPLVWVEAVGFWLSLWVNPKRKPDRLEHIPLKSKNDPVILDAYKLALERKMIEKNYLKTNQLKPAQFKPVKKESYLEAARLLGYLLGEQLFVWQRQKKWSKEFILSILQTEFDPKAGDKVFWELMSKLRKS